jgi:hypothetical protein
VALGVAGGYFLGRTKKMKLALMLAGMAAGRQAGGPGELLKSGTKLLGSSPELSKLTDQVRGRLLDAGKTAVLAVATRQVEGLTDRVGRRVESLGDIGAPRPGKSEEPPADEDEYAEEPAPRDEDEDTAEGDGRRDDGASDEAPEEEAPPARRSPARARAAKSSGGRSGAAATASVRRTSSGSARGAGKTAGRTAGKAANGRRSPRTRRTNGDG